MNNGQIFTILNTLVRKEKEGDTITPDVFSDELNFYSLQKANSDYSYFEQSRVVTDSIRSLMKNAPVTITTGVGNFITGIAATHATDTYWHEIGVTTSVAKVDLLTSFQFDDFKYSDLMAPTVDWPVAKISGDSITVLPVSITSVDFKYLKTPNTPFYDYYVDANDKYVYLEPYVTAGDEYTLLAGETYTDKEDGTVWSTPGDTIGSTSAGDDANNMSVEMSYPDSERVQVVYMLLAGFGITINEQDAVEYGLGKEQKEEAQ